jgi:hypothetical protein
VRGRLGKLAATGSLALTVSSGKSKVMPKARTKFFINYLLGAGKSPRQPESIFQ